MNQELILGTPLSPGAIKVMLLGSGELGKEVIIALQRLGVETIAVDRYDHAPGQQVAHHARTITMSDPAALRALIEAEKPALVVPDSTNESGPALPGIVFACTIASSTGSAVAPDPTRVYFREDTMSVFGKVFMPAAARVGKVPFAA